MFHEASVRAASSRLRHGRLTATCGRCARSTAIVPICTTPVGAHWGAKGFTGKACRAPVRSYEAATSRTRAKLRSEEHTSELQSLMRISYAVFCLKKKTQNTTAQHH